MKNETFTPEIKKQLLTLAKDSICFGVDHNRKISIDLNNFPVPAREIGASFVTLKIGGELRGCIGTLEAYQPLVIDIANNAYAAAFSDPRFPPLNQQEMEQLDIHISILNPAEEIEFESEDDLIAKLRPNIDGLILIEGNSRASFLPSVWESLPDPKAFLDHLKLKARLPANYWSNTLRVQRYTTTSFP